MSTRIDAKETGSQSVNEDALRDVLSIEHSVQVILQNAEADAARIIEGAKTQAAAMQADEFASWQETSEADREEFRRGLNAQAREIRETARQEIEQWLADARKKEPKVVEHMLRLVLLMKADG